MNAVSGSDQLKTSVEWRNTCKTVIIPEVSNKLFLLESNAATHFEFIIVCLPYDGFCMNSKQQLLTPSSTLPTNFSQLQSLTRRLKPPTQELLLCTKHLAMKCNRYSRSLNLKYV